MDLSIIIVNWNTRKLLENCLRSIRQTQDALQIQIIVVDNASADGSRDMVAALFPEVCLINSGGNWGFAKANNLAIPGVEAPLVLFLNPDTVVKENSLRMMIEFLKANAAIGALGCKIRDLSGSVQVLPLQMRISPLAKFFDLLLLTDRTAGKIKRFSFYKDPNASGEVSLLYGACLMVKKIVLDQVGGFDERFFMYCEDVDLCRRIGAKGWKLYYLHEAEIIHLVGGASHEMPTEFGILTMCESIAKLMEKYHGKIGRRLYTLYVFTSSSLRLFILALLQTAKYLIGGANKKIHGKSLGKHVTMIKWSLGWRRPKRIKRRSTDGGIYPRQAERKAGYQLTAAK